MAAELLVDAAEQEPPDRERQVARDAPEPFDRRGAAALGDLALDRAPEQVEHLGHHDHARDPMVAQGVEDDPWVPAPDIEHVGADIERVVQRRPPVRAGARGGAARRSGAPSAARCGGTTRSMRRRCRVPASDALGRARGAAREHELEELIGRRALPGRLARLPVGREDRVVLGRFGRQCVHRRGREVGQTGLLRIGGVAPGAEDEVTGTRRADDRVDRVAGHPQIERDDDEPGVHRAEVGGGQLGRRRAPGQDPVARLQVESAQPPGGDPRPSIEIPVGPGRGRSVVVADAKRRPVAVARHGGLEQVDEGSRQRRTSEA